MKTHFSFLKIWAIAGMICMIPVAKGFSQEVIASSSYHGYIPVNGLSMYYESYGTGEPIVLLHGAYMTIDMNWSQIIPLLSKNHRVIAFELQGHGHTADIYRPFSYPALAADVAAAMQYLKISDATVLGYSFGGTVAIQLAASYPELVKNLIAVSTVYKSGGWLPEIREIFSTFKPESFDQTPLMTGYKKVAPDTAYWHKFVAKMIRFEQEVYNLGDDTIRSIKSPVLMIMGDNDGVDLGHVAAMYKLLGGVISGDLQGVPKSHLAILPGKTHVSLIMDTEAIVSLVLGFLHPSQPGR